MGAADNQSPTNKQVSPCHQPKWSVSSTADQPPQQCGRTLGFRLSSARLRGPLVPRSNFHQRRSVGTKGLRRSPWSAGACKTDVADAAIAARRHGSAAVALLRCGVPGYCAAVTPQLSPHSCSCTHNHCPNPLLRQLCTHQRPAPPGSCCRPAWPSRSSAGPQVRRGGPAGLDAAHQDPGPRQRTRRHVRPSISCAQAAKGAAPHLKQAVHSQHLEQAVAQELQAVVVQPGRLQPAWRDGRQQQAQVGDGQPVCGQAQRRLQAVGLQQALHAPQAAGQGDQLRPLLLGQGQQPQQLGGQQGTLRWVACGSQEKSAGTKACRGMAGSAQLALHW